MASMSSRKPCEGGNMTAMTYAPRSSFSFTAEHVVFAPPQANELALMS
jgi:hypothetical protein